jgi:hypothetical protein
METYDLFYKGQPVNGAFNLTKKQLNEFIVKWKQKETVNDVFITYKESR